VRDNSKGRAGADKRGKPSWKEKGGTSTQSHERKPHNRGKRHSGPGRGSGGKEAPEKEKGPNCGRKEKEDTITKKSQKRRRMKKRVGHTFGGGGGGGGFGWYALGVVKEERARRPKPRIRRPKGCIQSW